MKIPIDWPLLLACPPSLFLHSPTPSGDVPRHLSSSAPTCSPPPAVAERVKPWVKQWKRRGIFERACTLGKDMDRDGMKGEIIKWRDCEHYVAGLEEKGPSFGLTD